MAFLFAGLSIVALTYFQRHVPETKNRSLQDIERDLDTPVERDNGYRLPASPRPATVPAAYVKQRRRQHLTDGQPSNAL